MCCIALYGHTFLILHRTISLVSLPVTRALLTLPRSSSTMTFYSRVLCITARMPRPMPSLLFGPLRQTAHLKFSSKATSSASEIPSKEPGETNENVHHSAPIPGWEDLKSAPILTGHDISKVQLKPSGSHYEQLEKKRTSKNKLRRQQRRLKAVQLEEQQLSALPSAISTIPFVQSDVASSQEKEPKTAEDWSFLSGGDTRPIKDTAKEPKDQPTDSEALSKEPWRAQKAQMNKVKKSSGISTWSPVNRITHEEQHRLKKLRADDPDKWNIQALSKEFKISPEAIIRIIKSRYRSTDLRPSRLAKALQEEETIDADEWARLSEEEKEILQMIEQSDESSLARKGDEEPLDENDPFGDLETVDFDTVEDEPKTIERKWEERYEKIADFRQRNKEFEEERAKIRSDLWGWQPLKANRKRSPRRVQVEKPVEVEAEAAEPEDSVEENSDPTSAKSTFNWVLALQNKKKTP
ncbi:Neugrin-related [Phaffia rhodozyma]|uniref:Neugrin-related n=1 Tax=Phaffia rhodozyma TaxID=264483 RepID=A0A0F7SRH0_PHARH|nr:Neugrin-related [Phaffia rhodozyma]